MQLGLILSFFDDLVNEFKENPLYFWIIIGALVLILVLLCLVFVIKAKNANSRKESNESKLIKSILQEDISVDEDVEKTNDNLEISEVKNETIEDEKIATKQNDTLPIEKEEPLVEQEALENEQEEAPVDNSDMPQKEELIEETLPTENESSSEAIQEVKPKKRNYKTKNQKAKEVLENDTTKENEESVEIVNEVKEESPKSGRIINGKYEVFSDGTDYYYTLKASNGELLITSEIYSSEKSVYNAIETIKNNLEVGTIKVRQDKRGLYQFVLIAKNNRTLVMSANYPTEKRAISASESFKRFAATSPVIQGIITVETVKEEIVISHGEDKKNGKIGIVKDNIGFSYLLKASNGEILVHSSPYKTIKSAEEAMQRFKDSVETGKFYLVKDKRGMYQFKLFSSAGRIVGVGETYGTKEQAISAANSTYSFVKLAQIFKEIE